MKLMRFLTNVFCLLVGLLFIFSGFVKAVDPEGFAYKLTEYFLLDEFRFFLTDFLMESALIQSVLICAFEIFLGFVLVLRYNLRFWMKPIVIMMVFFTFLTGYSWIFDVVKECGCFGNAIPLKAGQSFAKDIILMIILLPIYKLRKKIVPVFELTNHGTWITISGGLLSIFISVYGLLHLPLIDFRAYHEGANIIEQMNDGKAAQIDYFYLMQKGPTEELIPASQYTQYAADNWEMKNYQERIIKPEIKPSIEDFSIIGQEDITQDILLREDYYLFLISKHIEDANAEGLEAIAGLSFDQTGIETIALTASGDEEIKAVKQATSLSFNFHTTDEKALATFIRSNPGLVLMKGDKIIKKWHHNDIPNQDELKALTD